MSSSGSPPGGGGAAQVALAANTSEPSSKSTGPCEQIAKAVKTSKRQQQQQQHHKAAAKTSAGAQPVISDQTLQLTQAEAAVSAKLALRDNNNDAAFHVGQQPAADEQRAEVRREALAGASEATARVASSQEASSAAPAPSEGALSESALQRGERDIGREPEKEKQKQGAAAAVMLDLAAGKMDARAERDNELADSGAPFESGQPAEGGAAADTATARPGNKRALGPEQNSLARSHPATTDGVEDNKKALGNDLAAHQQQAGTTIDLSSSESARPQQQQQPQRVAPTINGLHLGTDQAATNPAALLAAHTHTHSHTLASRSSSSCATNFDSDEPHKAELEFLYTSKRQAPKRLGYFQSLLLRKWPCLALSICIMSSLAFGMLLSALTIYLMHGVSDCGQLAAAALAAPSTARLSHSHQAHQAHEFHHALTHNELASAGELADTPLEPLATSADPVDLTSRHLMVSGGRAAENATSGAKQAAVFQRLPGSLVPEHYNLFIWPHIAEPFYFNGSLEVHIKCRSATQNISLHTHEIDISQASIQLLPLAQQLPIEAARRLRRQASPEAASSAANGSNATATKAQEAAPEQLQQRQPFKVTRLSQDRQMQYSIIELDRQLEPGQDYLLRLDFVGTLNDDLAGFYKIKYERHNSNETTWIAATQFQATDARRAFPCFDEPAYKATFSIKIRHWPNMTALSNMPIVNSERSSDGLWITDTFAKSQRMSSYLVAWAVTNFESRSDGNISVWARPGFAHTAEYSLKIAGKILRHYEQFFGIEYPLPKLDMIALPDFNAGAMENWGLVTYRETAMLYDPQYSSTINKRRVATVVAHELAHQWFGNLVTPKWWDDLWLNEGFATFVEYLGVDHVEPKWRMLDQFVVDEIQDVLRGDSLSSSHQISIPVNNPDEISEIFDYISYSKGASVIRMMSHFLTERVFKLGLQRYLRALKYDNAEQSDLWAHLTEAQRELLANSSRVSEMVSVERVMNSWTLQTGYPLVTLTRNYESAPGEQPAAKLEQVRFEPFKWLNNVSASEQKWEIPITFTWQSEQDWNPDNTRLWLHQHSAGAGVELSRALAPAGPQEWMLLNVQQVGYYRVNYDERNWRLLVEQLRQDHSKISLLNRAHLMNDMFELARSSLVDYRLVLEATKYVKEEREYVPWDSVIQGIGYLDEMLKRTPLYGAWQEYVRTLIEPYYARYKDLEWSVEPARADAAANNTSGAQDQDDDDDALELYNQMTAISWACHLNNEHCIRRSRELFAEWRATGQNRIKPALRHAAYCTAIMHGDSSDWDFLWRAYGRQQSSTERDRMMRALACSREIWILARYLDLTFLNKSKPVRRQDGGTVFASIAKNNHGRDLAFDFLREHWALMHEYYGKLSFSLSSFIRAISGSMNTQTDLLEFKGFYEKIKSQVGNTKRAWQGCIEDVEGNVSWRNKHYKLLDDWLRSQTSIKV